MRNFPRSERPRTLSSRRTERVVVTELRRNRFASLHKTTADVRKQLKLETQFLNVARSVTKKHKYAICIKKKVTCVTPINHALLV